MNKSGEFEVRESSTKVQFPTLRLGYVALNDAIPFIVAEKEGIFTKYGLDVKLSREIGWATIRDKIEFGELDAAQALAPMPFAATLGLTNRHPMECLVSLILSLNGNVISLSRDLGNNPAHQVQQLKQGDFAHRSFGKPIFAVVSEFSSHHFLLRKWFIKNNINPTQDIHVVVLPPSQMPGMMLNGHIDGFCAGEPWGTTSVKNGSGIIAASSLDVASGHVEKVLMVSHAFAAKRSESHIRLIAALVEACERCEDMAVRTNYAGVLAKKKYLNCDEDTIRIGLDGRVSTPKSPQLGILSSQFVRFDENRPSKKHSDWILNNMEEADMCKRSKVNHDSISRIVFAEEYFESALKLKNQFNPLPIN